MAMRPSRGTAEPIAASTANVPLPCIRVQVRSAGSPASSTNAARTSSTIEL